MAIEAQQYFSEVIYRNNPVKRAQDRVEVIFGKLFFDAIASKHFDAETYKRTAAANSAALIQLRNAYKDSELSMMRKQEIVNLGTLIALSQPRQSDL